jgi:hypothetical protein
MIDLNVRVVYLGEKFEVTQVKGSDLVALERQFSIALPSMRGFTFEQACFLVWRSMRRAGRLPDDTQFGDEFLDGIEDLEQVDAPFAGPAAEASPG